MDVIEKPKGSPDTKPSSFSVKDLIGLSDVANDVIEQKDERSQTSCDVNDVNDTNGAPTASHIRQNMSTAEQNRKLYESWLKNEELRMSGKLVCRHVFYRSESIRRIPR